MTSLTPTANRVLAKAASQVGYHEGRSGSNWNNIQRYSPEVPGLAWSQGQAWCATFVSWVALKAGVQDLFPSTASTDAGAAWWKARKRWSEYPAIGAQGYLGTNGDMYHTFLVEAYDDTHIWTIEGNTNTNGSAQGDGVYRLKRRRDSASIQGYGYPAYPEGIQSADPAWKAKNPRVQAPVPPKGKPVDTLTAAWRVAEINLKSLPVNTGVRGTLRSAPAASVLLLNEADLDSFKKEIAALPDYVAGGGRLLLGNDTFDAFVAYKPAIWDHVGTHFVKTYDGVAGISKTRHLAVTVLRHKGLKTEVAFLSWHAVTAGNDKARKRLRRLGLRVVRQQIRAQKKLGRTVIVGGDYNATGNAHPTAPIHVSHGIDHQYAWKGSLVSLRVSGHHTKKTTSDHPTLVVRYTGTARR